MGCHGLSSSSSPSPVSRSALLIVGASHTFRPPFGSVFGFIVILLLSTSAFTCRSCSSVRTNPLSIPCARSAAPLLCELYPPVVCTRTLLVALSSPLGFYMASCTAFRRSVSPRSASDCRHTFTWPRWRSIFTTISRASFVNPFLDTKRANTVFVTVHTPAR